MYSPDVQQVVMLETGTATSSRTHLLGIGLQANWIAADTPVDYEVQGTIQLLNGGESGDILVEIPVAGANAYPSAMFSYLADRSIYVLFDSGIYVDEDPESGAAPMASYALTLVYSS